MNENSQEWRIQQYKAYLADVANIGKRHENTRRFYLSVVSALFVFLSMAGEKGILRAIAGPIQLLVGGVGIILSLAWYVHMRSFGAIYKAKFHVLREMEKTSGFFEAFKTEWECLKDTSRYEKLTTVDSALPLVFAILFTALMYFTQQG